MRDNRYYKGAVLLLFCWICTCFPVGAQVKKEVLKTGFYKTVTRSGYRVIDPQMRDTLYLDPEPVCTAADFKKVALDFDAYSGKPVIQIQLSAAGTEKFAVASKAYIGKKIAVITAGRLLSAPVVNGEITGGRLTIAGNFTQAEANDIVAKIRKELPPESRHPEEEERKEMQINQACNRLDSSLIKADTSGLKTLLHEQLSLGHSNGLIEDKTALLQHLGSGYLKYNRIDEQGYNEIRFAGSAAWVRRQLNVAGIIESQAFDIKLLVLEVWLWEKGQWQLWCRQSTKRQ
jgi:hypothetical protein